VSGIEGVCGVLLDVDGTLLVHDRAVPGAAACLKRLSAQGIAWCVTTNTTRRPRRLVADVLRREGLDVDHERILIPAVLARQAIVESGRRRALLLVADEAREDFDGVNEVEHSPDWVVIGDLGHDFTWDRVNQAFRGLRDGAGFLALQKNPWWDAGDGGPQIDAGAFVAALEFASGVEARVLGKPSRSFFEVACEMLGVDARRVLVVGDDAFTDGRGAGGAGCRIALVRTGKFSQAALREAGIAPSAVLDSIADLFLA